MDAMDMIKKAIEGDGCRIPSLTKVDTDNFVDFIKTLPADSGNHYHTLARYAGTMITTHPQYGDLAARLLMTDLYNNTPSSFMESMTILHEAGVLNERTFNITKRFEGIINVALCNKMSLDFTRFTYQGIKHLTRSYLLKARGRLIEKPHEMYMRIALGIHYDDITEALVLYDLLVDGTVSMATPIMFNSGTTTENLASCFIQNVDGSTGTTSVNGILDATKISEGNGGVGINYSGDYCAEFCTVLDKALKFLAPQGGLNNIKRPGVGAVYRSIFESDFLRMLANKRTDGGAEDARAKDLQIGMILDTVFLERLERCPNGETDIVYSTFLGGAREDAQGMSQRRVCFAVPRARGCGGV